MPGRKFAERDARISREVARGRRIVEIAAEFGLAVSTVYGITRREGWTFNYGPPQQQRFCERSECRRRLPAARNRRFCSRECAVAALRKHLPSCAHCGRRLQRAWRTYCNMICYGRAQRRFWLAANAERDAEVLRAAAAGEPAGTIAARLGVHKSTVDKVVRRGKAAAAGGADCRREPARLHGDRSQNAGCDGMEGRPAMRPSVEVETMSL